MTHHPTSPAALAAEAKRLADGFWQLAQPLALRALHATIDQLAALASQAREEAPAVAEVGDLVIDVRERVMRAGLKNRDKLYAAPPAPAGEVREGWISVADGLPKKNTEVLVFFEGVSTLASTGQYTASASDHDGWCYPRENYDDERDEWPKVTHWQPLPAAPLPAGSKGEKE